MILETINMLAFSQREVEMLLNGLGWRIDQATDDCIAEQELYSRIESWLNSLHRDKSNDLPNQGK